MPQEQYISRAMNIHVPTPVQLCMDKSATFVFLFYLIFTQINFLMKMYKVLEQPLSSFMQNVTSYL